MRYLCSALHSFLLKLFIPMNPRSLLYRCHTISQPHFGWLFIGLIVEILMVTLLWMKRWGKSNKYEEMNQLYRSDILLMFSIHYDTTMYLSGLLLEMICVVFAHVRSFKVAHVAFHMLS
jgi:hypothetical protein